jgi:hypothetical protein
MSEPVPPSALPSGLPARRAGPTGRSADSAGSGPSPRAPQGLPPPSASRSPQERLVALGVAEPTARALVQRYSRERVVDALDAVDTLVDGQVRRRAGWVVSAIRQGWDLDDLLAERRQLEARHARWEHERDERDRQAARWRARESAAGAWRAVLSATLDDEQLAVAVERVTTPVAGLGRRSVPIVRAQLLEWATAAHRAAAGRPLADVLVDDLLERDGTVSAPSCDGPLPPVPAGVGELEDDLTARLTQLLVRRPDLAHPGQQARERADDAPQRALGEGLGHGR